MENKNYPFAQQERQQGQGQQQGTVLELDGSMEYRLHRITHGAEFIIDPSAKRLQRCGQWQRTLTRLSLGMPTELENAAAADLAKFSNLVHLSLKDMRFKGEWMCHIRELTKLESLHITGGKDFTEGNFKCLLDLPKLAALDLSQTDKVTDESLVTIGHISGLTRLSLNRCTAITDEGLPALESLHKLQSLETTDSKVSNEAVADLASELPSLKHIQCGASLPQCNMF